MIDHFGFIEKLCWYQRSSLFDQNLWSASFSSVTSFKAWSIFESFCLTEQNFHSKSLESCFNCHNEFFRNSHRFRCWNFPVHYWNFVKLHLIAIVQYRKNFPVHLFSIYNQLPSYGFWMIFYQYHLNFH